MEGAETELARRREVISADLPALHHATSRKKIRPVSHRGRQRHRREISTSRLQHSSRIKTTGLGRKQSLKCLSLLRLKATFMGEIRNAPEAGDPNTARANMLGLRSLLHEAWTRDNAASSCLPKGA